MDPNKSGQVPYMSDEEVRHALIEYDNCAFDDVPMWLRQEVTSRGLTFICRVPSEQEQLETLADAREHRLTNNEKTVEDFKDKYLKGKSFKQL